MADDNKLTGINLSSGGIPYPAAQPMQMANPLAQIQALQGLDLQQQQLQQGQANLGENRIGAVKNMIGTLLTKPDLSIDDVNSRLDDMGRNKVIPPQEVATIKSQWAPLANDPAALRAKVKQVYLEVQAHGPRMELGFGQQISRDAGPGAGTQYGTYMPDRPGQVNMPGAVHDPSGTSVPNQPSTVGYTSNIPYRNKSGQISNLRVTQSQERDIADGRVKVDEYGRIIPAGGGAPAPPSQGAAMPGTGGGGIAEPPVGAVETQKGLAENAADIEKRIVNAQTEAPQRQADLATLEADMKRFQTGPYANMTLAGKRAYLDARSRIPGGTMLPQIFDPKDIAAQENFVKTAGILAQRQFGAIGGTGTDSKLDAAIKTNPGEALSGMGNQQIIAMLHGNEDAMTARDSALDEWKKKNPGGTADQFQRQFNKSYNPRAFQWLRMTPDQRAEMAADMMKNDPQSFKALKAGIANGVKMGIIPEDSVKVPGQ